MKTFVVLLLSAASAFAQQHIVSISPVWNDPIFGDYVDVTAEQLRDKRLTLEGASDHTFKDAYVLATWDCAEQRQTVIRSVQVRNRFAFFRARNEPCNELDFLLNPFNL